MCTAISCKFEDHYFGRTLDYYISYKEKVVITPRNYPLIFRKKETIGSHYAIIGMAAVASGPHDFKKEIGKFSGDEWNVLERTEAGDYPLYFDATNEMGLSMAGLHFPENADYKELIEGKDNITPFEFIPWILGQCASVLEAKALLSNINLVKIPFNEELPLSPLHWMISDQETSIVVESVKDGLKVYDNPVGVLTNNPPFPMQMFHLNNYLQVSVESPKNTFSKKLPLHAYSYGMGGMGLPGDFSSQSRFVRGAFVKLNSVLESGEQGFGSVKSSVDSMGKEEERSAEKELESASISQFFHIMESVSQPRGCVVAEKSGEQLHYEKTIYTSCCNTEKGIYYYTTYDNHQITGVDMRKEDLEGSKLLVYPLVTGQQVSIQN